jgi:hypothetical protein
MAEGWIVTDMMGNETMEPSVDDQGKPYLISYEVLALFNTLHWVDKYQFKVILY